METYLLNALLNAIAEATFGHPIIDREIPEYTPEEVRVADIAHAMREAFRAGQLVRGRA
ncbi:enoyl-ACP reductase [Burkholderia cenocepacia]|uniref:enoyl-ACP reductase n=1 Tax=Burkholderia cenocepacia TaxID=95486 RepID=UPI00222ECBD0|nr:enoyl-ACP reductase [Burkholderia cenocepacia]MCW3677809.1 enoyl-ACP reductase [Burkholderia cenocepacia]